MKKIIYMLFLTFMFSFIMPLNVNAVVNYGFNDGYHVVYIKNNSKSTKCDNVAIVDYDNTNIEYIKSFDNYDDALKYMNTLSSTSDKIVSIIGKRKDKEGNYVNDIINSEYALVDLNTTNTTMTTSYVYTSATNNTVYTYINGHGAFGGVDAAFIDYNNGTARVNMKISGAKGWINSLASLNGNKYNGYEIIPITMVRSPSYYYVSDAGNLIHKLSKKITANNCYSSTLNLGPAPSFLKSVDDNGKMIKYYSYDGIYFYENYENMLNDYKNNETNKAINIMPYYNYYLYTPIRVKSNATAADIKNFLESRGYNSSDKSKLYGEELTFVEIQEKYGVNSAIALSTAINESGWGTSALAKNKNNLFGHSAYDSSVMSSANGYNTVKDGIYRHAYYYINTLYAETKDYSGIYHGSHLGNKNSGMNVKYASDPYWGEKIAAIYRSIDAFTDYKDFKTSTIGVKTSSYAAPVYSDSKTSSTKLYTLTSKAHNVTNIPVYVLEKVTGESIDGNNIWYKIQTDALLNESRDSVIQNSTVDTYYDRDNNYGYVHSSYITLEGENTSNIYIKKDGLFGLQNLSVNDDKTVNLTGYLAIKGINNDKTRNITYDLILKNEDTKEEFEKPLDRILDTSKMPYTVPSVDKYTNEYSWFSSKLDLSDIKEGNYALYVRARTGEYEAVEVLSNILSTDIARKFTKDKRGYQFKTNYYLKAIPVELFIRDNGLINDNNTPTRDNMFNQYESIELKNGKLNILGSSFNVGGDYSKTKDIKRTIIFENITTFERYEYNIGYIDNGPYKITLIVPDNKDKTRAWFNSAIDLKDIEKGTYAIYVKTESNVIDYGELNDIFNREITSTTSINDKNYSIKVNQNQRFRLELEVK